MYKLRPGRKGSRCRGLERSRDPPSKIANTQGKWTARAGMPGTSSLRNTSTPSTMAEQIQVDVHALQMEYAQQLTNEDFGDPRFARQMEDAQLLRDVEMGDPGKT